MTELEELQAIIDNAPEGATHFTNDCYLKVEGNYCMVFNSLGVWSVPISNAEEVFIKNKPRVLSDIKTIVAALKYIKECPCDPDIYPEQLKAWNELQELLQ